MDIEAAAREIINGNAYMTLGTADADGLPWVTPVWFAPEDDQRFYWVSDPEARHSRNLAARPQLSIVIFDTHAPVGTGQGVYAAAVADRPAGDELEHGIGVFSRRSVAHGAGAWIADDVGEGSRLRLYRATATERWIGDREDKRIPVPGAGAR